MMKRLKRWLERIEQLAAAGGLQTSLSSAGIEENQLPLLASEAAKQWTGGFNPRPFDQVGAMEVYRSGLLVVVMDDGRFSDLSLANSVGMPCS